MSDVQKINPLVESVEVTMDGHDQIITLTLRYTGAINVAEKISENEELAVELPSHAPPG